MPLGKLKAWRNGYGFIETETGSDMFVHITAFQLAGEEPEVGAVYSYKNGIFKDKIIATHLKRVDEHGDG
ncbi:cold-shock protein [Brucella anthropi]|uniref:CSD domain-containing protein n=1 Tax=Brucella anthropi TaxID=529 RepID=A0A6L3YZ72_BRUAN|nr:cold shock domain-containing protein [Brucella anthropi]KAB2761981.1 hypothetical protein F9L04_23025 [Brucella anthropi]UVV66697.1 cold shock domain-containing protein [Brucella anthropi]